MKKKIPAAPVPAPAPKGFQKLSAFSKGMLIALSAIALLLVLVTFMDMSGFHLIWPEIIPLGCLLVLLKVIGKEDLLWLRGLTGKNSRHFVLVLGIAAVFHLIAVNSADEITCLRSTDTRD